jgi:hypothetical protein
MPSISCAKHSSANSNPSAMDLASLVEMLVVVSARISKRTDLVIRRVHGMELRARVSVLRIVSTTMEHEDAHAHCSCSGGSNTCWYRAGSACIAGSWFTAWHQGTRQRSAKKERWHRFRLCAHRPPGNSLEPGASPRRVGHTRPTRRSEHAQRNAEGSGGEQEARYPGQQIAPA